MLPAWLCVGVATFAIAFGFNRLFSNNLRWFNRLRRPTWLTFEWAIPWIWISIFICGAWSATALWMAAPAQFSTWLLLAGYVMLEILVLAYTPVMCRLRSLKVGTAIGAAGFFFGLGLAILVFPVSQVAFFLLLPYLLWSPIGTYVTWAMIPLNQGGT